MSKKKPVKIFQFFKKIKIKFKKRKFFGRDFFILIWIIICFFTATFSILWKQVEFELANIKSSGIVVEIKENLDERIFSREEIKSPLVAIVIDNYIDSRPSIGLSKAIFVWEAPVEASITRFLAVFSLDDETEKIGPVRSLRPYFIDWAAELGAIIIHCGGSPEALEKVKNIYTRNLDQFFNFNYFWRTWKRDAPHNVLTSTEKLREAMDKKNYKIIDFDSWKFKEDANILERPKKQEVSVDFWRPEYKVKWNYNLIKNDYVRVQNNIVHKDSDDNEIRAKNIVIQFTEIEIIDNIGRRKVKTIGKGDAVVFMDGKRITAFWDKPAREKRARFYDEYGEELFFNKGATWIEIIPIGTKVAVVE